MKESFSKGCKKFRFNLQKRLKLRMAEQSAKKKLMEYCVVDIGGRQHRDHVVEVKKLNLKTTPSTSGNGIGRVRILSNQSRTQLIEVLKTQVTEIRDLQKFTSMIFAMLMFMFVIVLILCCLLLSHLANHRC